MWNTIAQELPATTTSFAWQLPPSTGIAECRVRVVASDSSSSVLYNKLDGGGGLCGNQMPRNAPKLAQNLIDMVRDWIDAGAQQ